MNFPQPLVTVDSVLLTLREGKLQVALHRRDREPDARKLALPGGVVHVDEDDSTETTVRRMLWEKTGFRPRYLEQLRVFSGPNRDPRRWSLSVAYLALVPVEELEAAHKRVFLFHDVDHLPKLAFDHNEIVAAAVERVRNKSSYSTLPCMLLPERFTLTQMQETYEAILQTTLEKSNFRRKMGAWDAVEPTGDYQVGAQRPARLYRLKDLTLFGKSLG